MSVYRIYVEKKPEHAVEAKGLLHEIRHLLRIPSVTGLRVLNRYDVEGIDEAVFEQCVDTVFAEPQLDVTYRDIPGGADVVFATEFLPGQFDQRAASAAECIQLLTQGERPEVAYARVYLVSGAPTAEELAAISPSDVIAQVDASAQNITVKGSGQQQFSAQIIVTGTKTVFATGAYSVLCDITVK